MADQQAQYPDAQIEEPNNAIRLDPVHETQGLFAAIDWNWGRLPFIVSMFEWYLNELLEMMDWLLDGTIDFFDWLLDDS